MSRIVNVNSRNFLTNLLDYQEGMKVSRAPDVLRTEHVGNCLALAMCDNDGIGGLAHIYSANRTEKFLMYHVAYPYFIIFNRPLIIAETVVDDMLYEMQKHGSDLTDVVAKMAGEQKPSKTSHRSRFFSGGDKKSKIVKAELRKYDIPLIAEDLYYPRAKKVSQRKVIDFDLATKELRITYLTRYKSKSKPDEIFHGII